ncbi:MAG: DNA primase [Rikenellaceae bacterium]
MIDRDTIDRIYAAANIVDIIGDYLTLKRKGVNYQACCPFHNEKTPSFVVSPSKGLFRCFGCGKGGNAITFIMEHEGVSYPEALKIVAKRYGIEVKERELSPEQKQQNDNRESMFALNSWAAEYFATYLHHKSEGMAIGMSYFRQKRGFSDETIKRFALGFCPSQGSMLSNDALKADYKKEFLLSTGLSLERESDGSLFDRFRDRVIFPVHNISGRIVAFGGRTLRTDKKVAKYQNSPESEIYSKKRELYGLFFAKKAIQQRDVVIMVEGYTDVISMHQAGIENVVSSSGTSLTIEQIRLLKRFTNNITVIYDGDAAGVKAAIRGIDMILHEGMNVRVVSLPPEHDPDSFAQSHTADEVNDFISKNEEDFLTFKAKLLHGESMGDPIRRAEMISDMVGSISQIPDQIRRAVFVQECSRIMQIDESVLLSEVALKRTGAKGAEREALKKISEPAKPPKPQSTSIEAGSSVAVLEYELVKYLLKHGHRSVDIKQEKRFVSYNIAALIFSELDEGEIKFKSEVFNEMLDIYRRRWIEQGVGIEVPTSLFVAGSNPEVCKMAVDILTSDDNYIPSQLWRAKQIHVGSDDEVLSVGIPKAVMLYKSKVIEQMIRDLHAKLRSPDLDEQEERETIQALANLNRFKVQIAKSLQRLIL